MVVPIRMTARQRTIGNYVRGGQDDKILSVHMYTF